MVARLALALVVLGGLALAPPGAAAQPARPSGAWLDRHPLISWNEAGAPVPPAPPPRADAPGVPRCAAQARRPSTAADHALLRAGWTLVGAVQLYTDTAVLSAMTAVDGMCRPLGFQTFVFVGGVFAGTLSPVPMDSRTDGAGGTVRLLTASEILADFARYTETDPLCCPSRVSRVSYRVDYRGRQPVVVPLSVVSSPAAP